MTEKLSRPQRRALQREDDRLAALPLDLGANPRSMEAHVRHTVRLLRNPGAASPCADAVTHLAAVFDRTVPAAAAPRLACRKGCSHCCTQMVTLSAPEAFFVAAAVRQRPDIVTALAAADGKTRGLSLEQRLSTHLRCPLLEADACAIYTARPLGCHGFVSMDLQACIAAFDQGGKVDIPAPGEYISVLHACRMMLMAALRLTGLPDTSYEMNEAVAIILATENAEAQWLAGTNILAGAGNNSRTPPHIEQAIARAVAHIAPTL